MKILYKLKCCLILSLFTLSCNKWVDVKPTDRLGEDQLFVNKEGYLKALNGVYVEMANEMLYGRTMTAGAIDVLANYYYLPSSVHTFYNYTVFSYQDAGPKAAFNNSWVKAYELIANCNVILEKCGNAPSDVLPEPYYGIIKGEALALRAMLHFDMLRLYGPIYNEANKAKPAIPYVNKTGFEVQPLSSSEQVMSQVTGDLNAALELMANTDPVRTEGVRNIANPSGPNDLYYRQYRLNFYAAKALLSRAYLWQNKKADALAQAESLLAEVKTPTKTVFPYITFAAVSNVDKPDRMFSTEVMFSLYNINRVRVYNQLFDVNLVPNSKLSFTAGDVNEDRVNSIYDDANDYRRRVWQNASSGTVTATTNVKFADVLDGPGRYMMPLIRISEVLLIAAECHPDLTTATAYFNELRTARNCVSLNPANEALLKTEIGKEYRREMLGEGQTFFFYKRNAYATIPNHTTLRITPEKSMSVSNYTVPLPDSEIALRN